MLKIEQAIIVEGKYDKIKLSSIIDGIIIQTNGYGIFKDKEKLSLIRFYAEKKGIIILTDSDSAGFRIRGYLKGAIPNSRIVNVYIPDIFGKEHRKDKPSKEGKLGVEGIDKNIILEAFSKAGVIADETSSEREKITKVDFYECGLTGAPNSSMIRSIVQKKLGLPELLTTTSLLEAINTMFSKGEFEQIMLDIERSV